VPTALGVLRSCSTSRPAHVFAAAADLDPARAVTKAIEELDHTRLYTVHVLRHVRAPSPDNEFEGVYQQVHHLRLAAEHANVDRFAFVFDSPRRVDFRELPSLAGRSPEDDLAAMTRTLTAAGLTPYVADLTSADVRELGLSVVRALVPGMHPLVIGHRVRARGGRRLYEVPQKCGHPALTFGAPDNPFPHPYP
jgi:ribosomal protein S12 methylthiotransferase accessory factor